MPFTETSGTRICWEESGSGEPLLLIMGATFPRQLWERAVRAFEPACRVIWYDNRGIGDSGRPSRPFTVGQMADDARAVMDAAGVGRAAVYGVSMGGVVAQELALSSPDRVRSLVLGCTWAPAPDKSRASWSSQMRYRIPQSLLVRLSVPLLYGPRRQKAMVREDLAVLRGVKIEPDSLRGQAEAVTAYSVEGRLGAIGVPVLVLHGDKDRVVPIAWGRELAAQLPSARFLSLAGAGHNYLTDATEESCRAVLSFLQDVAAPDGTIPERQGTGYSSSGSGDSASTD